MEADSNITLERHVVDVRKALAEYREASARWHDTPAQKNVLRQQRAKPLIRSKEAEHLFVDHLSAAKKTFTVLSLHISNIYAKKRGIGKKLILTIRAVMHDEKGGPGGW